MDEQKTNKRKSKEEEKFTAKKQKIETEETKVSEIVIDNFEVRSIDNYKSVSFQEIIKKVIEKIKEEQEQKEKKKKQEQEVDSTDVLNDTMKSSFEELFRFFQEEVESLNISSDKKLVLKILSNFLSIEAEKKYNKSEKIKRILKMVISTLVKS